MLHTNITLMGISISSEEVVLISTYIVELFLFIRRFSDFNWQFTLLAAVVVGVGTGIFIWPWAYIIFGWPGSSLGAMASSILGLKTHDLVLVGALVSAAAALSIVALGVTLLLILPTMVCRNL